MLDVDPHVTRHTRFEHTVDRVTRAFVFLSLYVQKVRGTQGPETAPHDLAKLPAGISLFGGRPGGTSI